MRRRIIWKFGDSCPDWAYLSLNVTGTGTIQIPTGFPASSVVVSFARTYLDKILEAYGSTEDIYIQVDSVNNTGFVLRYQNIPNGIPLEINYLAM